MMPGTAAEQLLGQQFDLPTARGIADFVAGNYSFDGVTLTAGDVTDATGMIGASGLAISASAGSAPFLLNDFATLLIGADWTAVVEAEIITQTGYTLLITTNDQPATAGSYYTQIDWFNGAEAADQSNMSPGGVDREVFDSITLSTPEVVRIAVTRRAGNLSLSCNGRAVVADTTTEQFGVNDWNPLNDDTQTTANLGGYPDYTINAVNIRKVVLYDSQPDVMLPRLSA